MKNIGWAIQLTRCAHLDEGDMERYAVNLVMPFSEDSLVGGTGPSIDGAAAVAAAGDLLKPWKWQETRWQMFARPPKATPWSPVGPLLEPSTGVGKGGDFPCDTVFDELMTKGAACKTPFSPADDMLDLGETRSRSLPHLLAPLTHWPAAVSNGELKLAGFVELDKATLDALMPNEGDALELACFPAFGLDGKPGRREPGIPQDEDGAVKAGYAADPALVMATQPFQRSRTPTEPLEVPADPLPRAGARELAAQELAPLAVLAKVATRLAEQDDPALERFAVDDTLRGAWRNALWAYFGTGWEAPYELGGKTYRDHVLERLMPPEQAALLMPPWQPNADAFDGALAFLTRPASGNWDTARRAPWESVAERWSQLAQLPAQGEQAAAAGKRFLGDWLEVAHALLAPETAGQFATPWFVALMDGNVPGTGLPQALDAQALRERAVGERILQANAIGVLSECAELWTWLANPVADKAADTIAAALLAAQGGPGAPPMAQLLDGLHERLEPVAYAYLDTLAARANPAGARPCDGGIPIVFEAADPGPGFDEAVRGYAIALGAYLSQGSGQGWIGDTRRSQWITDTAVLQRDPARWLDQRSGGSWWMHETVGSTLQDGIRSTSVDYQGRPVAAMRADEKSGALLEADPGNGDPDGSDAIDFRWRAETSRDTPLMGYGLAYKWAVACIDNAGGVVDPDARAKEGFAVLEEAKVVLESITEPQWHYCSAVPPGAPVLVSDPIKPSAFECSDDTRAHAHQAWLARTADKRASLAAPAERESLLLARTPGSAKVALLAHGQKVKGIELYSMAALAHQEYKLTIAAPAAPAAFVERWLNTDIVLLEHGLGAKVSDPAFTAGAGQLTIFRDDQLEAIRLGGHRAAYHPAVGALGVAVWFDGAAQAAFVHRFDLIRTLSDGPGKPIRLGGERHLQLSVKSGDSVATSSASAASAGGKHTVEVTVTPGSFARIRVFSLVSDAHFAPVAMGVGASTDQRFYEGIELPLGDAVPAFPGFRSFGPAEHWFEAAPRWSGETNTVSVKLVAPGTLLEGATTLLAEDLMAFDCTCSGSPAWIRSMFVQRHDWHWTGYPVRLPHAGAELKDWLTSFSGVESYRDGGEVWLDTGFAEDPVSGEHLWRYGSDADGHTVLQRKPLQSGTRPARYAAFTARPLLRLRSWLNQACVEGPLVLEQRVYGDGALIMGRMPALGGGDRLPAPPLRWAVPLTSTYAPRPGLVDPGQRDIAPGAPGNLLVFDDALRRTDALSRLGGVGDTLEIDLVETRLEAYREIGVNPIFHANPKPGTLLGDLDLRAQEPFGLTHDIGSNALVAQTGVIVTPQNAQGKWIMAKVRARRLILPETLTTSRLQARPEPDPPGSVALPLRVDGDTILPLDFALDTLALKDGKGSWPVPNLTIHLSRGDALKATLTSEFPDLAGTDRSKPLRFLCSWHKNRWNGSTASWRLQVLAQQRDHDTLAWRTVGKRSGFQNPGTELESGQIDRADLSVAAQYTAHLVPMSDYTDPMWLTFIGSFGTAQLGHAEQYSLRGDLDWLRLGAEKGVAQPQLLVRSEHEPRFHVLLVYRPLADITRGSAPDGAGALLRTYRYDEGAGAFKALPFADGRTPDSLDGCHAYLCTVQCITALSKDEKASLSGMDTFDDMIALMFPARSEPGIAAESTIRLLPEFIGPIPLV